MLSQAAMSFRENKLNIKNCMSYGDYTILQLYHLSYCRVKFKTSTLLVFSLTRIFKFVSMDLLNDSDAVIILK
jgi:hypothetical protein